MKKLLGLLAAFGLTASAGSVVIACEKADKTEVEKVKESIVALTASSKAEPFATQELAEAAVIALATATVNVEIKAEAGEGTFELVLTIADGEATKEITLHVLLTEVKEVEKTLLTDLIKVLALGEFEAAPQAADILTKVTELNVEFTSEMHSGVDVTAITATSATITAKSDSELLDGTINVTFTVAETV
ncbi:lipoprotein [Spiroplasma endosymbiont of Panorpa germanica]|uniref:lipoprotein n=1 Tax=Spiroplasma endosymbiont of Panorpa germanica TaxID=3066314 RepID=UPI0030CDA0CE